MPKASLKTIKILFTLSGNLCAFPNCTANLVEADDTVTGQICHIVGRNGPRHDPAVSEKDLESRDNLILLCPRHHKVVDDNPLGYPAGVLRHMRANHEALWGRTEGPEDERCARLLLEETVRINASNNSGNLAINSPCSIQGNNIRIVSGRRQLKINPPVGAIGADIDAAAHISYLIGRYNEFAGKEPDRTRKFNFGAISKNIEDKFGRRWALLPISKFDAVREYLEGRISRTRIAKANASKGHPSYSSFAERKCR